VEREPLFDKPKRKHTGIPPLKLEELEECPYHATDDDLPTIFWPEPNLDEEAKK
jgi:hypothetical protein